MKIKNTKGLNERRGERVARIVWREEQPPFSSSALISPPGERIHPFPTQGTLGALILLAHVDPQTSLAGSRADLGCTQKLTAPLGIPCFWVKGRTWTWWSSPSIWGNALGFGHSTGIHWECCSDQDRRIPQEQRPLRTLRSSSYSLESLSWSIFKMAWVFTSQFLVGLRVDAPVTLCIQKTESFCLSTKVTEGKEARGIKLGHVKLQFLRC